jgi:hypothetical protein
MLEAAERRILQEYRSQAVVGTFFTSMRRKGDSQTKSIKIITFLSSRERFFSQPTLPALKVVTTRRAVWVA